MSDLIKDTANTTCALIEITVISLSIGSHTSQIIMNRISSYEVLIESIINRHIQAKGTYILCWNQPGFKYNLTDISAVLGLGQLAQLDAFNARRTQLANRYLQALEAIPEIKPLELPTHDHLHAWHLFIVRVEGDRDGFMAALKEQNIGTGLHFRAVHLQKYYTETFGIERGLLPNTEWNSDRILSLPLCPSMSDADLDDVVDAIKTVLKKG